LNDQHEARQNWGRGLSALLKPVADALAAAPAHSAIKLCATSQGKPWTVSGFRASWQPIKIKLEENGSVQPGLTLKGLRHTVATILREMNMDYGTIANVLGQRTEAMASTTPGEPICRNRRSQRSRISRPK